ncbi:MAG: hypothetical protein U9Q66_04250 [Patescibacteria group bacterium]|nr:hypothetical protein [Patescibacteria group bacterium]
MSSNKGGSNTTSLPKVIADKMPDGWVIAHEFGVFLDKERQKLSKSYNNYIKKGYELGKHIKIVAASEIQAKYRNEVMIDNISYLLRGNFFLIIRQHDVIPAMVKS